ncbi:hypothetical protein ACIBL3_33940 [Kribbella sp. NPDC050124]|uniref:hypothetical protein n=1 Tax=Kribbella sp. NPDC050124 TaxID=3364114 RepID=UPI0037B68394
MVPVERYLAYLADIERSPNTVKASRRCYSASRSLTHAAVNSPKTTSDSDDNSPKPSAKYEQPGRTRFAADLQRLDQGAATASALRSPIRTTTLAR